MNIRTPVILATILFIGVSRIILAEDALPSVELRARGEQVAIAEDAQQQLRQQALELVKTSNFHSGADDKHRMFTVPDVHRDYRKTIAGTFLLVSFPAPQKILTIGGEIMVTEIVVGLNRDDYASDLFTIDSEGAVVGHSKYAGALCVQILKTTKQSAK